MTERPGKLYRPKELAAAFDRAADTYDARPGYPDEVYGLLAGCCGLGPGARVLEIGPGAGQATRFATAVGLRCGGRSGATTTVRIRSTRRWCRSCERKRRS